MHTIRCRDCAATLALDVDPAKDEFWRRAGEAAGWMHYAKLGVGNLKWPWTCPAHTPPPGRRSDLVVQAGCSGVVNPPTG